MLAFVVDQNRYEQLVPRSSLLHFLQLRQTNKYSII